MSSRKIQNTFITIFVVIWLAIFHYESIRYFYLEPLFGKTLPKVKFLFPPAGWIMFYNVGNGFGDVEVYGVKNDNLILIDPHDIFRVRTIGFDNIHRGILGEVADPEMRRTFCPYLHRLFPYFDNFVITTVYYPNMTKEPYERRLAIQYQCRE